MYTDIHVGTCKRVLLVTHTCAHTRMQTHAHPPDTTLSMELLHNGCTKFQESEIILLLSSAFEWHHMIIDLLLVMATVLLHWPLRFFFLLGLDISVQIITHRHCTKAAQIKNAQNKMSLQTIKLHNIFKTTIHFQQVTSFSR